MLKRMMGVAIILVFISLASAQEERITITTYYPSPFGSYHELTTDNSYVNNGMAIGDVNGDGTVNAADMAQDNGGNPLAGSLSVAGRVGIGTINPRSRLDVNGAIRYLGPLTGTIFYGGGFALGENDAPGARTDGYRVRYQGDFFGGNHDALIFEKTDGNSVDPDGGIAFVNRGSDGIVETAMVIRGDGNVGIGTLNPATRLDINGGIRLANPSGAGQENEIRYNSNLHRLEVFYSGAWHNAGGGAGTPHAIAICSAGEGHTNTCDTAVPKDDGFCYMRFWDNGGCDSGAACNVSRGTTNWEVEARSSGDCDRQVRCAAMCVY